MFFEAYGGEVMRTSSVFERHKRLKDGREKVEDEHNAHHFLRYRGYCSL